MNKRGVQLSTNFGISLFLVVIFFIIVIGVAFKINTSRECPVGYDLITNAPNNQIENFCGSFENQDRLEYRCCQRKSNVNEICRYDLNDKEVTSCLEIANFEDFYERSFICGDETACGEVNDAIGCAGVACGDNQVCVVQNIDGEKQGSCSESIQLIDKEVTVIEDGVTPCGLKTGPTADNTDVFGLKCEKDPEDQTIGPGEHCVLDAGLTARFNCRGHLQ